MCRCVRWSPQGLRPGNWLLIAFLAFAFAGLPHGAAQARPLQAALIVDGHTGKTVYSRNANARRYPASLTKIMTLYLLFEQIRAGRIHENTRLRVSRFAASQPPSKLGLKPGTTIRVKDAIRALVTKSANDVAVVVAEALAGTQTNFARRMTATARRIGMKRSVFRNASGLPNASQVTTARDMVVLARSMQARFPKLYKYFKTRSFKHRGRVYRTHNGLVKRFRGTDGIKTGYTRASGFNLVSSVRRGNKHVVGVVLGGRTARERDRRMMRLIDRAFPRVIARRTGARRLATRVPVRPIPLPVAAPKPIFYANTGNQPRPIKSQMRLASAPLPQIVPAGRSRAVAGTNGLKGTMVVRMPKSAPKGDARGPVTFSSAIPIELKDLPDFRTTVAQTVSPSPTAAAAPKNDLAKRAPAPVKPIVSLSSLVARTASAPTKPTVMADTPRSKRVEKPRRPGSTSRWLIQIGAYAREEDARKLLSLAQQKARRALRGKRGYTMAYATNTRKIFRVRFAGFTRNSAVKTCRTLKRHAFRCYTLSP